jgi:phosphoribosyl-AMP cyclohydrolase
MLNDLQIFLDGELIDENEISFETSLAVLQHEKTDQVISVFEINQEAFLQSIKTNKFCYFNRSKNTISTFGLLDGNFASITKIYIQKDPIKFLFKVKMNLSKTCFGESFKAQKLGILDSLLLEINKNENYQDKHEIYKSFSKNTQNLILENSKMEISPSLQKLRIKEFAKQSLLDLFSILSKNGLKPEDLTKDLPKI